MTITYEVKNGAEVVNTITLLTRGTATARDTYLLALDADTGEVVGCVGIRKTGWMFAEVRHLHVQPFYRRNGVATGLLNNLWTRVVLLWNSPFIVASCKAGNSKAAGTFLKAGYNTVMSTFHSPRTGNNMRMFMKAGQLSETVPEETSVVESMANSIRQNIGIPVAFEVDGHVIPLEEMVRRAEDTGTQS